jgi:hypothetical protein
MLPRPAALGLARALVPAAALVALLAGIAFASAGDDAASKAKNTLSELEAKRNAPPTASSLASGDAGASSDGALAPKRSSAVAAADDAIAEANRALKRAQELRANADVPRAELAEDLALEWALTARETVAAVEGEREADDLAVAAVEATTKADRARTLLEEAITRRGKLQAKLDELDAELAQKALDAGPVAKKKAGGK